MSDLIKNIAIPDEVVMSKIYVIRNEKVMLDRDLSELYGVETKVLKQSVKRNIRKYKNKQTHQIWTHENHAEQVYSQKFLEQKIEYIHQNPVRAGIVIKPEEYLYSSARAYAGLDSMLPVIKPDLLWKT